MTKTKRIIVCIDIDQLKQLDEYVAGILFADRSKIIRLAIEEYLKINKKGK